MATQRDKALGRTPGREPAGDERGSAGELHELRAHKSDETVREVFDSIAQIHLREMRVRSGLAHRLGEILIENATTPSHWLRLPFTLLKEYKRFRKESREAALAGRRPRAAPLALVAGAEALALPLTRDSQQVVLARSSVPRELWCKPLTPTAGEQVQIDLALTARGRVDARVLAGQSFELTSAPVRTRVRMHEGEQRCLLEIGPSDELTLELANVGVEPCLLKLELFERPSGPTSSRESPASPAAKPPVAGAYIASELDRKLWGGYAEYVLPELERIKLDPTADVIEREDAAWYLIRWYMAHEDYPRALDSVEVAKRLRRRQHPRILLAEAQCLLRLGRLQEARACLTHASRVTKLIDFPLLASTVARRIEEANGAAMEQSEAAQLQILNGLLKQAGLSPLEKAREGEPLSIANLRSRAQARSRVQAEKVSVIIPAFNAGATIGWVLRALLDQTWRNLEILVVDDLSTDNTREIVKQIALADGRVKLIERKSNGGAYAARNTGVRHATGELIMVHDADDWSHPQRIELQIEALKADPKLVGVKTHWVRVTQELHVVGEWIARGTLFDLNYSSFIFRRELLDQVGLWDEVAVSGDGEFFSRVRTVFGEHSVLRMPPRYLVAFSLAREDSLTRGKATHLRTLFYGLRWHYKDAYLAWHARLRREELPYDGRSERRPFPVPLGNRPGPKIRERFDIVIIADFAREDDTFEEALSCVAAAAAAGLRTAVFHWRSFELRGRAPLRTEFYRLCQTCDIAILSPGDVVDADVVLFGLTSVLGHKISPFPDVHANRLIVIVEDDALATGERATLDSQVARAHLQDLFGMEAIWVPSSPKVAAKMSADGHVAMLYPRCWLPLVDIAGLVDVPLRWRARNEHRPVIGRITTGSNASWPVSRAALTSAYGVDQPFDLRILGDMQQALQILGMQPANWAVVDAGSTNAAQFICDLDFYVCFPEEGKFTSVDKSVLFAMALGIPAVVPSELSSIFGSAAICAEPHEVPRRIAELWHSRERYLSQAEAGRHFVLEHADFAVFRARLSLLTQAVPADRTIGPA